MPMFKISFLTFFFVLWLGWPFAVLIERMCGPRQQTSAIEVIGLSGALVCILALVIWSQVFGGIPDVLNKFVGLLILSVLGYLSYLYAAAWKVQVASFFKFLIMFFSIYFLPVGAFFLWHISREKDQVRDA